MECYIKDYPRPQFVRNHWVNLNGVWEFAFDDANVGEKDRWYQKFEKTHEIMVPSPYETKASGIEQQEVHDHVWYHRQVEIEKAFQKVILHFEGSDYETKLWVNGSYIGNHVGGYSRFSMDITNVLVPGTNDIVVKVSDSLERTIPRGKQRWKEESFECWYVQTTGIWKTVWLEYLPEASIQSVKMTPNREKKILDLEWNMDSPVYGEKLLLKAEVSYQGQFVNSVTVPVLNKQVHSQIDIFSTKVGNWGLRAWTPWDPALYDIKFTLWQEGRCIDTVGSYFGMRDIRIEGEHVLLNGDPIYQRLILDQGYWKDSHLTPPSEEALVEDIDKILQLGYNGVRKHQKIEDEKFLYWCDVKGLLVWSEAPATYYYNDEMVQEFMKQWMDIVRQNYNHPSIITWAPINESWGVPAIKNNKLQQKFTEAIYSITKALDPYRPVIVNDGWEHTVSDIITLHDYQASGEKFLKKYLDRKEQLLGNEESFNGGRYAFAKGYVYKGQPVIISEYGGIAFQNDDSGWGYGDKVRTEEEFIERFDSITTAIKKVPYITGYCYTQVTDVQQEINGLMSSDREFKVDCQKINEINQKKFGY